jgi:hypothetical protein
MVGRMTQCAKERGRRPDVTHRYEAACLSASTFFQSRTPDLISSLPSLHTSCGVGEAMMAQQVNFPLEIAAYEKLTATAFRIDTVDRVEQAR